MKIQIEEVAHLVTARAAINAARASHETFCTNAAAARKELAALCAAYAAADAWSIYIANEATEITKADAREIADAADALETAKLNYVEAIADATRAVV